MLLYLLEVFLIRWDTVAMSNFAHQKLTLKFFSGSSMVVVHPGGPWKPKLSMNVFYSLTGFLKPKSNQENPSVFIRSFGPLLDQLNRTTTVVWYVHIASRLTFFIWFWWRQLVASRSFKFVSCQSDWGAHAKKRSNLIYQYTKNLWQNEGVRRGFGCSERDPQTLNVWKPQPLLYGVIFYVIVKASFLFSACG